MPIPGFPSIASSIKHEKFSERNQLAHEIIRIRKLINLLGKAREAREKMSSIIHTFLIISLVYLDEKEKQQSK